MACYRVIRPGYSRHIDVALLLAATLLTLMSIERLTDVGAPFFFLFLPAYHTGTYMVSLWCAALGFYCLRGGIRGRRGTTCAFGFVTLCLLGAMGDLLFLVYLVAPFTAAAVLAVAVARVPIRRALLISGLAGVAAYTGILLNKALFDSLPVERISTMSVEAATTCSRVFFAAMWRGIVKGPRTFYWPPIVWLVVCTAVVVRPLLRRARRPVPMEPRSVESFAWLAVVVAFLGLSGIATAGALIVGGISGLLDPNMFWFVTHYLPSLFFTAWFGLALVAACVIGSTRRRSLISARVGAVSALMVALFLLGPALLKGKSLYGVRPEVARLLDEHAEEFGLTQGIGGYGGARFVTLFSQKGLRASPYGLDAKPPHSLFAYAYVGNRCWFKSSPARGGEPPRYDFVLAEGFWVPEDRAVAKFGTPAARLPCGPYTLLVYNRPGDSAVRDAAK
jgi:hypothetical protein